jgi:riboflavin kinase
VGTVFSGKGEGKKFINLPWVKSQIKEKLCLSPYAGTLNIHLNSESVGKKKFLGNEGAIWIEPQTGYCPGVMFKAQICDLDVAVVVPKIPNYPNDVLEVIAPVCLRERLKLVDGFEVAVSVSV